MTKQAQKMVLSIALAVSPIGQLLRGSESWFDTWVYIPTVVSVLFQGWLGILSSFDYFKENTENKS